MVDEGWLPLVRELGVPVALLLVGFSAVIAGLRMLWVGFSKVVAWVGEKFVEPLRDRIIKFFDDHTAWMRILQEDTRTFREVYTRHDEWERGQATERSNKVTMLSALNADLADRVLKLEAELKQRQEEQGHANSGS